jgi:ATP-dependent RNA helicase DDX24/MAK5
MSSIPGGTRLQKPVRSGILTDGRKSGKQRTTQVSKNQLQAWKQELEQLLSQPLRAGFSARYLTSGSVNLADRLVNGDTHEAFLGMDSSNALDDIQKTRGSKRKVRLGGKKAGGDGV